MQAAATAKGDAKSDQRNHISLIKVPYSKVSSIKRTLLIAVEDKY
jgi:sporulation protein YlmC with PRC-barrel domain